ncbi:MAG: 4-hydroxy-tetrahydrodipicolinate synthase [Actinobacteria bacterium]|nr:4-hydroxy-tetrahydrodipicolinate synthase [Actinomycetota bacterium]
MPTPSLRGVYVPLITPFAADGSVAFDAIEALACEYLDAGAAGLVPLGTTGEAPLLDGDEKRAIVELCARIGVERDAQVIVGSGTNNTASTVEATMAYGAIEGVSHAMVVVPYYVRPSQAGIVAHVTAAADASPVPVVVYNIPIRSGRVLEAPGMLELAAHPNVVGVKQAVDGIDMATLEILAGAPRDFAVLGGDDPYLFPTVLLGGAGAICASAHVCTDRFVQMIECGLAGKVDEGRAHHEALLPVVKACFTEPNPSVFKAVLHAQGKIPTPDLRLPLLPASAASRDAALAAIEAAAG